MDKSFWQETVGENAHEKSLGSCYQGERGVCTKEGEGVSTVEKREKRSAQVHRGTTEERIY